ncbi:Ribosomal protein S18 acetylase RimI [Anaerocolumna jejuensis DSM 15929]|uniref:Ribosomal protein S18 acetylase RimI n=1 Tax=Anaerocolumna jejuensis DSM 15929 TaxID=1121322 RepID=A0A1M7AR44_9FIRM|nr:GNAT family N-acetyltransferase [Anaerocolumna jejuensis]SHL45167.1 Ribosomal protein S18 acetylase RimI [Anaerocolumna jejuensis DSM 15929]
MYEVMKEEHIPLLASMYTESFNSAPWYDKWTVDSAAKRLTQMLHCEGAYGLISYDNYEISGMILGNHEIYYDCMHFNIKEFCVNQKMRGTGIGSILLEEFEKRLREMGIGDIYLFTTRTLQTEGFYQRKGYVTNAEIIRMDKNI